MAWQIMWEVGFANCAIECSTDCTAEICDFCGVLVGAGTKVNGGCFLLDYCCVKLFKHG